MPIALLSATKVLSVVVYVLVSYICVMVLFVPVNLMSAKHRIGAAAEGNETVAKLAVSAPVVERAG